MAKKQSFKFKKRVKRFLNKLKNEPVTLIVTTLAILLLVIGVLLLPPSWDDAKANLSAELIGMALTVLVLDGLYSYRDNQREKRRVIQQMASPSNEFALHAVNIADNEKWLFDGSLRGVNLSVANLKGAILWGTKLEGARLAVVNLENANLRECQFQNTYLGKSNMKNSDLREANLIEANLTEVDLTNANLEGANLRGAILTNANLHGANLKNTVLENADLKGAIINKETKLPDGFDIETSGIIMQKKSGKKRLTKRAADGGDPA